MLKEIIASGEGWKASMTGVSCRCLEEAVAMKLVFAQANLTHDRSDEQVTTECVAEYVQNMRARRAARRGAVSTNAMLDAKAACECIIYEPHRWRRHGLTVRTRRRADIVN